MTPVELKAAAALRGCRLLPGSPDKRFILSLAQYKTVESPTLTDKQWDYLSGLTHRYRGQIGDALHNELGRERETMDNALANGGFMGRVFLSMNQAVRLCEAFPLQVYVGPTFSFYANFEKFELKKFLSTRQAELAGPIATHLGFGMTCTGNGGQHEFFFETHIRQGRSNLAKPATTDLVLGGQGPQPGRSDAVLGGRPDA
jgi:hypothetical protein